jgi:hypothetical protein
VVRVLTALTVFALVSGCSLLDQIQLNGSQLDPNKVYLGASRVSNLNVRELGRYGCIGAPLLCEQRGIGFDCRCP